MKRLFIFLLLLITIVTTPSMIFAQGTDGHTAREEAEGKEIWEKLQTKQLECKNLTDDNYGFLGEYFMGQMMGSSHEAMNIMMEKMMGKVGEEQMHVIMGKRLSGCQSDAQIPQSGIGYMPMMWMMGGGGNPMMGGWNSFGMLGWLPMLLFWILLILGVVVLVHYQKKSSLDILKERYAKGEIDKKEFEQMKKDLN